MNMTTRLEFRTINDELALLYVSVPPEVSLKECLEYMTLKSNIEFLKQLTSVDILPECDKDTLAIKHLTSMVILDAGYNQLGYLIPATGYKEYYAQYITRDGMEYVIVFGVYVQREGITLQKLRKTISDRLPNTEFKFNFTIHFQNFDDAVRFAKVIPLKPLTSALYEKEREYALTLTYKDPNAIRASFKFVDWGDLKDGVKLSSKYKKIIQDDAVKVLAGL